MNLLTTVLVNAFINALAQIVLKVGVNRLGGFSTSAPLQFFLSAIGNLYVWLGTILYVISLAIWLVILSKANVSYVYPIMALSYVFGILLASLFLGEKVLIWQWVGVGFIILGVFFITKSV